MNIRQIHIITSAFIVLVQSGCLYLCFTSNNTHTNLAISFVSMLLGQSIYILYLDIKACYTFKITLKDEPKSSYMQEPS